MQFKFYVFPSALNKGSKQVGNLLTNFTEEVTTIPRPGKSRRRHVSENIQTCLEKKVTEPASRKYTTNLHMAP